MWPLPAHTGRHPEAGVGGVTIEVKLKPVDLRISRDFSGGPVVKNLPAGAGVMGSIPGPERSRMLRSRY